MSGLLSGPPITLSRKSTWGLFTKERIMFRKQFRITIRFLIRFVIWTTCIHKHCNRCAIRITNRICALQGNILFLLRWLTRAWLQREFPKCTRMNQSRSERALYSHVLRIRLSRQITIKNAPFLHFKNFIWKSFAFIKNKIRLSNQERVRITIWNGFRNVIHYFVNRPMVSVTATKLISIFTMETYMVYIYKFIWYSML